MTIEQTLARLAKAVEIERKVQRTVEPYELELLRNELTMLREMDEDD